MVRLLRNQTRLTRVGRCVPANVRASVVLVWCLLMVQCQPVLAYKLWDSGKSLIWWTAAADAPAQSSTETASVTPQSAPQVTVTDTATTPKPVNKPYTSRIIKDENNIVLKGQVPSENDVKLLQGVIAATSPGATLIDKSHVNPAITDRDTWLAGMTFALRQMSKFERGAANLRDNQISFEGSIKSADNLSAIQQKVMEELPKGLVLAQLDLKQSSEQVSLWVAQIKPGTLSLTGLVPKDFDQPLITYAKAAFQNIQVESAMSSGSSAPNDWMETAKFALDMLKYLQQGNATVHGNVLTIDGVCTAPGVTALLKEYEQKLPKGFRLEINVLEPSPSLHLPLKDFVTEEERAQYSHSVR